MKLIAAFWARLSRKSREVDASPLTDRVLLELRRAGYGTDVPIYVSAVVLASRLGVARSELDRLLGQLVKQRVIFPGLTPGTYGLREWSPPSTTGA